MIFIILHILLYYTNKSHQKTILRFQKLAAVDRVKKTVLKTGSISKLGVVNTKLWYSVNLHHVFEGFFDLHIQETSFFFTLI